MIWSVSTSTRSSGATSPVCLVKGSIVRSAPIPHVHEVTRDGGRGGHGCTPQVGAAAFTLATLEISVRRAGAALAWLQDVWIHAQAHAAACLAPLEPGVDKD